MQPSWFDRMCLANRCKPSNPRSMRCPSPSQYGLTTINQHYILFQQNSRECKTLRGLTPRSIAPWIWMMVAGADGRQGRGFHKCLANAPLALGLGWRACLLRLFWVAFCACDAKPPYTITWQGQSTYLIFQALVQCLWLFFLIVSCGSGWTTVFAISGGPCRLSSPFTSRKMPHIEVLEQSCLGLMPNQPLVNVQRPASRVKAQFGRTVRIKFLFQAVYPRCQVSRST